MLLQLCLLCCQVAGDALQATMQFLVAFPEMLDASAPNATLNSFLTAVASGVFDIVSTRLHLQVRTAQKQHSMFSSPYQSYVCLSVRPSVCLPVCPSVCLCLYVCLCYAIHNVLCGYTVCSVMC